MAIVCLAFVANVSDGTFLKPAALYFGTILLLIASLATPELTLPPRALIQNLPVMLFLGATLLSLVNAHDLLLGAERFCQIGCCAVFYLAVQASSASETDRSRRIALLVLVAVVTSIIPLLHFVTPQSSVSGYFLRQLASTSTFGNKAYFGGFLATMLPLAVGYAWSQRAHRGRLLMFSLAVAILLVALLQTGSRSSWIGAAIGCVVLLALVVRTASRRLIAVGAFVAVVGIGLWAAPTEFRQRVFQLFESGPQSTAQRRIYFYEGAWKAFAGSPFLGQGAGNFAVFLPKFRSPDYWMVQSEDIVPHAHDEFLEILSESGLVGFISFGLIVAVSLTSAARKLVIGDTTGRILWAGIIAAIAACLTDNLFNMSLRTVPVALLFWILLGLTAERDPASVRAVKRHWRLAGAVLLGSLFIAAIIWYTPRLVRRYGAEKMFLRGLMARYQGKSDETRKNFEQAVRFAPRHMEARFFLAANLTETGNYQEAIPHLEELLADRPYYPRVRTLLAIAKADAGDSARAMRLIAEELELETSPQAYYFGSHTAARIGNVELQRRYLFESLRQNIRSGTTDYLLEALDDLPSACQTTDGHAECVAVMESLGVVFAGQPDIIRRLEEIRLSMRTG